MPPLRRLAGRALTIATCTPLVACSLLFTPAEPGGIDSDSGTTTDARAPADAGLLLCDGDGFRWSHRQPIAFAPVVTVPQKNVPVGIRFTPSDFTTLQLPDDPSSLHFVEAVGSQMPHEVEAWDPDVGGLVWVLVNSYPGEGDELAFDMFHGDPEATALDRVEELWLTAGYSAVFHFNRDTFKDSMNPGLSAAISEEITATEINAGGGFGHAMRFPGLADKTVLMAHNPSHQSEDSLVSMSLEARFQATHPSASSRFVIQKPGAYSITSSTPTSNFSLATVSALDGEVSSTGRVLDTQNWFHAALNVNATSTVMEYFLDGAPVGTPTIFGTRATSVEPLTMGASFQGDMDELRISRELRPARWFELQNALFTGDLQSFGAPVKCAP